jgi:hypothetical protein
MILLFQETNQWQETQMYIRGIVERTETRGQRPCQIKTRMLCRYPKPGLCTPKNKEKKDHVPIQQKGHHSLSRFAALINESSGRPLRLVPGRLPVRISLSS